MQISRNIFSNVSEIFHRLVDKLSLGSFISLTVEAVYFVNSHIGKKRGFRPTNKLNKEEIYKSIKEDPIFSFAVPAASSGLLFLTTKNIVFLIADLILTVIFFSLLSIKVAELSKIDLSKKKNRKIVSSAIQKILAKYWKQILIRKGAEISKSRFLSKSKSLISSHTSNSEIIDIITKELINEFKNGTQNT